MQRKYLWVSNQFIFCRGTHEIEQRSSSSRNSDNIDYGDPRLKSEAERTNRHQSNVIDRSRDRDRRYDLNYSRSRSSGRYNYNDNRFDRNNRYGRNRGGDQMSHKNEYERNHRGTDKYYNKYDDRFRDRNNRSRRDQYW